MPLCAMASQGFDKDHRGGCYHGPAVPSAKVLSSRMGPLAVCLALQATATRNSVSGEDLTPLSAARKEDSFQPTWWSVNSGTRQDPPDL